MRRCFNFLVFQSRDPHDQILCQEGVLQLQEEQIRREGNFVNSAEKCPHAATDKRCSRKSVSRMFCKLCGTFVDEMPQAEAK